MIPERLERDHPFGTGLWKSYEYLGTDHGDVFHPAYCEKEGGPNGQPFVWVDDTMWSIDTPENPHSILVLLHYQSWDKRDDGWLDLRNATVEFRLRGDELALHGAKCFFWVSSLTNQTTRWHYVGRPFAIADGCWEDPVKAELINRPDLWHRSFASDPENPCSLDETLGSVFSYGFSFVGFSRKVTGRFSLGSFACTPYHNCRKAFTQGAWHEETPCWQTVSYTRKRQVCVSETGVSIRPPEGLFALQDDFIVIQNPLPFAYLGFVHSDESLHGRDLRNARIIVEQFFHGFDAKGGAICFFVENTSSGTIWIFRERIPMDVSWSLGCDEQDWHQLMGSASLESVLSGSSGDWGYDYFGFMAVGVGDRPAGCWGLNYISVMPMDGIQNHRDHSCILR